MKKKKNKTINSIERVTKPIRQKNKTSIKMTNPNNKKTEKVHLKIGKIECSSENPSKTSVLMMGMTYLFILLLVVVLFWLASVSRSNIALLFFSVKQQIGIT